MSSKGADQNRSRYRIDRTIANWSESLSEVQFAYLLLGVPLLILSSMAFWPLINTFELSLHTNSSTEFIGPFVGVDQYLQILGGERDYMLTRPFFAIDRPYTSVLFVTIIITVVSVVITGLLGMVQAVALNMEFRWRRLIRTIILIPWALPIVVYGMVFYLLFQPGIGFGVDWVQALGGSGAPLASAPESTAIIILAIFWRSAPFVALIVLAGLQSIDESLYNVAKVTGATPWQRFRTITFPLIKSSLAIGLLFVAIAAMKVFGLIVTVNGDCTVVTSLSCIVFTSFNNQHYATAAALAFITAVVIAIVAIPFLMGLRGEGQ